MNTQTETRYADTLGLRLLRELTDEGYYIFTTEEAKPAAAHLGMSEEHLRLLLSRLVRSEWIVRLRRGLYATTGEIHREPQIHPFVVATSLVSPAAISHWSAMHHHGLTEQIPQGVTALTPRKVVTPSMRSGRKGRKSAKHTWKVANVSYEYVTVKPEHFFGIEEVWVEQRFKVPITDKERTMLEGFVSPRAFGSMDEVLGILEENVHELDVEKLVGYALSYGKASVAKRLGWALEQAGAPDHVLDPLEKVPVSGVRVLDTTRRDRGPCNKRWMIQNNLTAEMVR